MDHSKPLREELNLAVIGRRKTLHRSKRKDKHLLEGSLGIFERFLFSYPHAKDEAVRSVCLKHIDHLSRVLLPTHKAPKLHRLLMEELRPIEAITAAAPKLEREGQDVTQLIG